MCNCIVCAGGCCKHVAALLYYFHVELGLAIIPDDNTSTKSTQWNKSRNIPGDDLILFSEIQFVKLSYRKCKTEFAAARLDKIISKVPCKDLQVCLRNAFNTFLMNHMKVHLCLLLLCKPKIVNLYICFSLS